MIMMGNRSGSQDDIKHINFETGEDLRAQGAMDRYRARARKPKET